MLLGEPLEKNRVYLGFCPNRLDPLEHTIPFAHCKSGKIWIFPGFGRKPLEGPLVETVNRKVVWDNVHQYE